MTKNWQWRTLICWASPKAIEFDQKKKIFLILPKQRKYMIEVDRMKKNIFNISTTTKIHFSVKFIRSYWIGQVNNPRIFWMNKIGIIEIGILKRLTYVQGFKILHLKIPSLTKNVVLFKSFFYIHLGYSLNLIVGCHCLMSWGAYLHLAEV